MSDELYPAVIAPLVSKRAHETLVKVKKFVDEECIPADTIYHEQVSHDPSKRWASVPPIIEELKVKAKKLGLWNMFLHAHYKEGPGFTNVEYGLMAEQLGRCLVASEAVNCAAPDTGNMEVFAKYANEEQKREWLVPLLEGRIRSAFCMTERFTASSDATNIQLSMRREGNEYVLNGRKWWASGAGDPRCKVWLVMGKTDASNPDRYRQQSVIIVPAHHPGSKVIRPTQIFGYDDAPHGHCEIEFTNCRVPAKNIVLGEGRGFEIIQGRLGPGRIHHCMRSIGAAEEALRYILARVTSPERRTFGKVLADHATVKAFIADARIDIDAGRLLVLQAAHAIDVSSAKDAQGLISSAKIYVPSMALRVIDRAIQLHGAGGVSQDFPLAYSYANQRTLRIADGPDEVHRDQLGRRELKRAERTTALLKAQSAEVERLRKQHNIAAKI
ncbi:hypothetical protein CANCADRAFT_71163 [Tortispora caseinolytica NRRL Y-17796]|uniref:Acyl-CoA dehydrogenase NM domain-like protein n=1 Tax=Tortispora caseinolytica NRRL Y-17796 TaxID=767744 RepID=A0A1E4TI74_9ASCO|nr:hypothetical protein CANCADRAFT_71163 [Tortispora caseinolytica NRRL Y-17796]